MALLLIAIGSRDRLFAAGTLSVEIAQVAIFKPRDVGNSFSRNTGEVAVSTRQFPPLCRARDVERKSVYFNSFLPAVVRHCKCVRNQELT